MGLQKVANTAKTTFMLIGQCLPCTKQNASKILVKRMDFDTYLNMYFPKKEIFYALDPEKLCKTGDVVLIQELPEKMTKLITHSVLEIVHKYGDVIDPITGKRVVVGKYQEEIDRDAELFGKTESTFDYKTAPPRGWQSGKKDFTDRETYKKYHAFPEEDPYAV